MLEGASAAERAALADAVSTLQRLLQQPIRHEGLISCPNSGRIVGDMTPNEADCAPMPDQTELGELVAYLVRSSRLSPAEAARVVNEVLAFLDETADDFIRRRHLALQAQGRSNSEIFAQIASELGAAPLSRARLHRAADPASHLWLS